MRPMRRSPRSTAARRRLPRCRPGRKPGNRRSPLLQFLFSRNAFFDFAVEHHNRHPVTDQSWEPDPEIIDQFREWLLERELLTTEEREDFDEDSRAWAVRQIHADIFNSAFGTEAAHRVLARGDVQIQAALGYFDEAAEILAQRRSRGEITIDRFASSSPENREADSVPDNP